MEKEWYENGLWIDYFRELDTTNCPPLDLTFRLWIDYFRELDTTRFYRSVNSHTLWIDYFRELDTTSRRRFTLVSCCGLITLGN